MALEEVLVTKTRPASPLYFDNAYFTIDTMPWASPPLLCDSGLGRADAPALVRRVGRVRVNDYVAVRVR